MADAGYNAAYYVANKDKELARGKAWKDANCAKCRAAERRYKVAHPERVEANRRKQSWKGIVALDGTPFDVTDYDRAFTIQAGRCLICRRHASEFSKRLAVDHDHKTGKYRALLCHVCNFQIGVYERIALKAQIYLSGGQ